MTNESARIIVGFFPEKIAEAIPSLIGRDAQNLPAEPNRYEPLRLPGETVLRLRVSRGNVKRVVEKLRGVAGAGAIYVTREHPPAPVAVPAEDRFLDRVRASEAQFNRAVADLEEGLELDHPLSAAGEWLYDNAYMVRTQAAELRRNLPPQYPRWLGRWVGDERDLTRVRRLAKTLVLSEDCCLSEAAIRERLRQNASLTMRELWAFPIMLKLALLEALAEIAFEVARDQRFQEAAYLWANRLSSAARRPDTFAAILSQLESERALADSQFAVSVAEQLQEEEHALAPVEQWIESRLGPLAALVKSEHAREAAQRVTTANAFGSLRMLAHLEFSKVFEAVSPVEAMLRSDPGGIYGASDSETRDECRRVLAQIAEHSGATEIDVARKAVELARRSGGNVPFYLIADGVHELERESGTRIPFGTRLVRAVRRRGVPVYLTSVAVLSACFVAVILLSAGPHRVVLDVILAVLASFPLSELAIQIANVLVITLLPPGRLPKLELRDGIGSENATLVVVPMLLISAEGVRREVEKLEIRYLANQDPDLCYSLFSDFTDSAAPDAQHDDELLAAARDGIETLNRRHGGRFLLFHRPRVWSESEGRWIGRERKRGKLEDLNAFLCGEGDASIVQAGKLPGPIRYVITLDADTQLPPGTGRRMVATIAHPLNRIELDPRTRVRVRGYSIIQPRVSVSLPEATATRFTRVFASAAGTDPYCKAVSDAHQDLFAEGIFHGKAIYDVRAVRESLKDRFPPETLLSHDLIEGAHAGVGLASDIELFENIPLSYSSYSRREHRWIRGDWQIASWIFGRVPKADRELEPNPLSVLNRWRIADNLRRSVTPLASVLLLLIAWTSGASGVWSVAIALAVALPAFAPLFERWAERVRGAAAEWDGAAAELGRAVVNLAFLPHQAWLATDAIVRSIYRSRVSRRNLLEWETAEASVTLAHRHLNATLRHLLIIAGCAALLIPILYLRGTLMAANAFLILWAGSPALLLWLNQPGTAARKLAPKDSVYLRTQARRTWRYFDDLVNEESNWLPPDNSQLALRVEVAERTSPTNIGLWLTAALAARDFGYITPDDLLDRTEKTLHTLNRLERYEGHPLNWYDTRTLAPLMPKYVSTVDSGNLLAALWTFDAGVREILHSPVAGSAAMHGLRDTLLAAGSLLNDASMSAAVHELRRLLHGQAEGHHAVARLRLASAAAAMLPAQAGDREASYWVTRLVREIRAWNETAESYLGWMDTLARYPESLAAELGEDAVHAVRRALHMAPSLKALATGATEVDSLLALRGQASSAEIADWMNRTQAEYERAAAKARETVARFEALQHEACAYADGINMRFLYDPARRLFGVGYAVGAPVEFKSHYDLMASECRLASLVAIAKGDVPVEHWSALGRTRSSDPGEVVLLSWSGTMFEYLMPRLFVPELPYSLLAAASQQAVEKQIAYARSRGIPWGISESAYSALDNRQTYQYRAFGVPDLALKRELDTDLVVAPYATMLALMVDPEDAIANLRRLEAVGLLGPMGFYESVDYSRARDRAGDRGLVIYAYMAHHQGMSLAALDNRLQRGAMQRRFHSVLRIQAFESLLYERVPIRIEKDAATRRPARALRRPSTATSFADSELDGAPRQGFPCAHLNGNGRYTLLVTRAGAGFSTWNGLDVTRWRSDPSLDDSGMFVYVRDTADGKSWIANRGTDNVTISADRAEFRRRESGIETKVDVTVAADDDVELRRVAITNESEEAREIEITSYVELALAPHRADGAHPAFSKMFIETEYAGDGILLAHRRSRSPEEAPVWSAHALTGAAGKIEFETDRATFLGHGKGPERPEALDRELNGSQGAVLDPVFSLRCRIVLERCKRADVVFLTAVASTREEVLAAIQKYRDREAAARAFEMAWIRAQLEIRYLRIRGGAVQRFQELAGRVLYPSPALRGSAQRIGRNRLGQSSLWAYGISGDLPILAVTIGEPRDLPLVRELLLAHAWWRNAGLHVDLVILNQEAPNYDRPLRYQIEQQIQAHSAGWIDSPGGVFLRDWEAIPADHRDLILAAASVVMSGNRGSLEQQLFARSESTGVPQLIPARERRPEVAHPLPELPVTGFNGLGGFTRDGREYVISGGPTPVPWSNVIANVNFGTMVTESGLGYTWSVNSQASRVTPWHNDPVRDPQSEVIYLRDESTGAVWSATRLPAGASDACRARHGLGYSVFECNGHGIRYELTVFVPPERAVKVQRLRLRNDSNETRSLSIFYFVEWTLGASREEQQLHITTGFDEETGALTAWQSWNPNTAGRVAFAWMSPRAVTWSGDRGAFFGGGSRSNPATLGAVSLDKRTGPGLDPCGALQAKVTLGAGEEVEVVILLGEADSLPGVRSLIREVDATKAFAETRAFWDSMASTIQVRTPSTAANVMLNGWLVYQTLSCRFWGRSALYQSGGAFGFRDQLQDVLALIYASPNLVREHILRAAARQFVEGDVQHWWHPDTGNGVRTRCSDDLVWLAYAVAQYVAITGDRSILEERVAFLEGPALGPGESERMFVPSIAERTGTVYEHCQLALERAWQLGRHGLPLMGSGDWNDGMNRVGVEGRGESVWLAWFLGATLDSFAGVIEDRDSRFAELCRERARAAALAVENAAWDGEWYLRAYFDDGSTLGSRENEEARIDSIAQSWAVISGLGDHERARVAMDSAERILVDERARIIELFTPPFDHSLPHPGYIMGYPPGVRENGGQYTHAALWVAMARARMGDGDSAVRLLTMLNPIEHTSNAEGVVRYGAEPYVIAADVSAAPGRTGRAGWTWYTGSAGWMYRIWIEEVLGFKRRGDELRIEPAIPEDWPGFTLTYRYGSTTYEIEVDRAAGSGNVIRLVDDGGRHSVRVGVRVAPKREARPAAGYSLTETSENGVHEVVPLLTKKG